MEYTWFMKFRTIRKANFATQVVIIFLFVISLAGTVVTSLSVMVGSNVEHVPLLLGALLFLVISFLLYLQSYAWYTGYRIEQGRLHLQGVYSHTTITLNDVVEARPISDEEAQSLLKPFLESATMRGREGDLRGWYRKNKEYGEILKYCTVQMVQAYAGGTTAMQERFRGLKIGSALVYLRLREGKQLLLSPVDTEGFVQAIVKASGSEYLR